SRLGSRMVALRSQRPVVAGGYGVTNTLRGKSSFTKSSLKKLGSTTVTVTANRSKTFPSITFSRARLAKRDLESPLSLALTQSTARQLKPSVASQEHSNRGCGLA